ncbi:MAG: hypothetical protein WC836_01965 [Desulfobacula sp.]|jgi:hypothetical protein
MSKITYNTCVPEKLCKDEFFNAKSTGPYQFLNGHRPISTQKCRQKRKKLSPKSYEYVEAVFTGKFAFASYLVVIAAIGLMIKRILYGVSNKAYVGCDYIPIRSEYHNLEWDEIGNNQSYERL